MTSALSVLRAAGYSIRRGLQGMRETPLVQLLAVATTAVCMLLLAVIVLAWLNVRGVFQGFGVDVPIAIYLAEGAPEEDVQQLRARLEALPEVDRVELVEAEAAMQRLADGLGGERSLLEGIDAKILPRTLELHLDPEVPEIFSHALAQRLEGFAAVDEVALAGAWATQAHTLIDTLGHLVLWAALLVALASIAIVWNTIRLAVYARRAEVHILRLVGGTTRFVRGPFLVEGALQGALGAAVALGLVYVGFRAIEPFLREGLSFVFAASSLRFFFPSEVLVGVALGAGVGVVGSRIAAGRSIEQ